MGIKALEELLRETDTLQQEVAQEAADRAELWGPHLHVEGARESAANFAAYLALRRRDLRPLQDRLMVLGLSSLGRLEGRVEPTLRAVQASLALMAGQGKRRHPTTDEFFAGQIRLAERSQALLGTQPTGRPVALLVTCPRVAADGPRFMRTLAEHQVEAIRINCAHDSPEKWERMVHYARAAGVKTGHHMRIFMDLAGPKIRTGASQSHKGQRIQSGDVVTIVKPGQFHALAKHEHGAECTLAAPLDAVRPGDRVSYDDGKLSAVVEKAGEDSILLRVESCALKGVQLKPGKGLNFPDTDFDVETLGPTDLEHLAFAARHADGIGFSFVQSADDVSKLQAELTRCGRDCESMGLILKIETPKAVANLPDMLIRAAGRQPTGVMIARGDLAAEIGFTRLAEMQEELLWLCEAAQVPVIWATQVMEHLMKKGTPQRGEMTDAAMAARAECVMLNKGPYLTRAISELDKLFLRMGEHQTKKTPRLRALQSW